MQITILTLFPQILKNFLDSSITGKAQKKGLVEFAYIDIRKFAKDRYKSVDNKPYGGGIGMLMRVDILYEAIQSAKNQFSTKNPYIVLTDPRGKIFSQDIARDYSRLKHLILICGHYEGVDERINKFIHAKISLGKFILTGGEIPVLAIADAVTRLVPGVLPEQATTDESFSQGTELEYPQYTYPPEFQGLKVPEVLLSGNHKKIKEWKDKMKNG